MYFREWSLREYIHWFSKCLSVFNLYEPAHAPLTFEMVPILTELYFTLNLWIAGTKFEFELCEVSQISPIECLNCTRLTWDGELFGCTSSTNKLHQKYRTWCAYLRVHYLKKVVMWNQWSTVMALPCCLVNSSSLHYIVTNSRTPRNIPAWIAREIATNVWRHSECADHLQNTQVHGM